MPGVEISQKSLESFYTFEWDWSDVFGCRASSLFGDNGISEIICEFLLIDLLKKLELVYSAGVIYNDITLNKVLVRDNHLVSMALIRMGREL